MGLDAAGISSASVEDLGCVSRLVRRVTNLAAMASVVTHNCFLFRWLLVLMLSAVDVRAFQNAMNPFAHCASRTWFMSTGTEAYGRWRGRGTFFEVPVFAVQHQRFQRRRSAVLLDVCG